LNEDIALLLEIISILLMVGGVVLFLVNPVGILTYRNTGLLLLLIGFITVLLTGLITGTEKRS
jgi:hypothetical protein